MRAHAEIGRYFREGGRRGRKGRKKK